MNPDLLRAEELLRSCLAISRLRVVLRAVDVHSFDRSMRLVGLTELTWRSAADGGVQLAATDPMTDRLIVAAGPDLLTALDTLLDYVAGHRVRRADELVPAKGAA